MTIDLCFRVHSKFCLIYVIYNDMSAERRDSTVTRQWLRKDVSTATRSRDRRNRYARSNRGTVRMRVRVTLGLAVYRQSVRLADKPLVTHDQQFFIQLNICIHSPYVTSSLMRGRVCSLQLLLAFASALLFRSASRPRHFTPGEIATGTHWIGEWVGPRAGRHVEEKNLAPTGTQTPTSRLYSP
jgi:hypothetical protein